jgi:uncharacterized protein YuzE
MSQSKFSFRLSVETRDTTGEVMAVYFQIRKGKSHRTQEYAEGNVFADYDKHGDLLGIEMLAPCRASVLNKIAKATPEKRFVQQTIPRGMLVTT